MVDWKGLPSSGHISIQFSMSSRSLLGSSLALLALSLEHTAQCELQALRGRNTVPLDAMGKSISLDGTTIVAGAYAAQTTRPGSAHVFELQAGDWVQTARLIASDGGPGDEFGNSVGVSGKTIVVGSEYHDTAAGSNSGAAYVFEKLDGKWVQTQILAPHDAAQSKRFGEYVAISGDVIVVGNRFDADRGNNAGAAYVFERVDGTWVETAKLVGSDGQRNDLTGDTVAVDGLRIVVGSYRNDAKGSNSGAAYVFEKLGGVWSQTAKLVPADIGGEMARGVALDGERIVLGARLESTLGGGAGAGYVFERVNGDWTQTAKLLPSTGAAGDWIGEAVAVSGDVILLSAHHHDRFGASSGVAYVFELQDGSWVETAELVSSAPSPLDEFSHSVAMSGNLMALGAVYESGNVGAAYVFTTDESLCGCGGSGGGTAVPYGMGLGGANIGTLSTTSTPDPGSLMRLVVSGIPGGTNGFVWMNTRQVNQLAYGGTILAQLNVPPIKLPFNLFQGRAELEFPVSYSLCGRTLYAQATAVDPTQPQGRAFTNGLRITVGQ